MSRRMMERGPDAEGLWKGQDVVLGHRRLSILDLSNRANQPFLSQDGRHVIVFNGEIYNFGQLRKDLEARGDFFRTSSDTEVLLALYARMGEAMLALLRGMFAFAIWDVENRQAFLARDPYGIKPLYYTQTRQGVAFASQVQALLTSGLVPRDIEPAGLAGFYLWGSVQEPWTLYRGTFALPAGHCMHVKNGVCSVPVQWTSLADRWNAEQERLSGREVQERVRAAVSESVQAHLVSDVPVSVFLSGGIDSGVVSGLAAELGQSLEGITIGFREFAGKDSDEVPASSQIAQWYGIPHHVRPVRRNEFEEDLNSFLEFMDQPTIDGVNSWFAAKAAAERGYKVVLSGVGGDELFHGYGLAREIPASVRRNRLMGSIPASRRIIKSVVKAVKHKRFHPKLKGVPDFMGSVSGEYFLRRCLFLPEELPELIDPDIAVQGLERLGGSPPGMGRVTAINAEGVVCLLDSVLYMRNQLLRDSDWTSMAHSLELRTPLVDIELLGALQSVQTQFTRGAGKRMLAHSPSRPLPENIINRPKTGFAVPMNQWLAETSQLRTEIPLLSAPGTPWTRKWAAQVMESFFNAASSSVQLRELA